MNDFNDDDYVKNRLDREAKAIAILFGGIAFLGWIIMACVQWAS